MFQTESKFYQGLFMVSNIVLFGIISIILTVPVVTAGAAWSAMYKMLFDIRRQKFTGVKTYFRAFAGSFKNATLIEIIQILSGIPIVVFFYLVITSSKDALIIPMGLLALVWFSLFEFAYAYTGYFEQTVRATISNSALMMFGFLPNSVWVLIATAFFVFVSFVFYKTILPILPVWVFVFLPLTVWFKSALIMKIFKRFDPEFAETEAEPAKED